MVNLTLFRISDWNLESYKQITQPETNILTLYKCLKEPKEEEEENK